MRFPLFDQSGELVCSLREEEARELFGARMAAPRGKRSRIRSFVLIVNKRQAWGFLRGKRSAQSQASRTFIVEHVGPERARLYQHDHQKCGGWAA